MDNKENDNFVPQDVDWNVKKLSLFTTHDYWKKWACFLHYCVENMNFQFTHVEKFS